MNIKPKTYTKLVNFKISPEEYEILKAIADSEKNQLPSCLEFSFVKRVNPILIGKKNKPNTIGTM